MIASRLPIIALCVFALVAAAAPLQTSAWATNGDGVEDSESSTPPPPPEDDGTESDDDAADVPDDRRLSEYGRLLTDEELATETLAAAANSQEPEAAAASALSVLQDQFEAQEAAAASISDDNDANDTNSGATNSDAGQSRTARQRRDARRTRALDVFAVSGREAQSTSSTSASAAGPSPQALESAENALTRSTDAWLGVDRQRIQEKSVRERILSKLSKIGSEPSTRARLRDEINARRSAGKLFAIQEGAMDAGIARDALDLQDNAGLDAVHQSGQRADLSTAFKGLHAELARLGRIASAAEAWKRELNGDDNASPRRAEYELASRLVERAQTYRTALENTARSHLAAYPLPLAGGRDLTAQRFTPLGAGTNAATFDTNYDAVADQPADQDVAVWKPRTAYSPSNDFSKLLNVSEVDFGDGSGNPSRDLYLEQRAVASYELSRYLEPDPSVVATRFASRTVDGASQFGIVMERAAGGSAAIKVADPQNPNQEITFRQLTDAELDSGDVRRQLATAQFLDSLAGQVDRHMGNIAFERRPDGRVRIRLIDNDQAFGTRNERYNTADADGTGNRAGELMPLPLMIDQEFGKQLLRVKEADVERIFGPMLPKYNREQLVERLEAIQEYIRKIDFVAAGDPRWNAPASGQTDAAFVEPTPRQGLPAPNSYYHALRQIPDESTARGQN